MKRIFTITVVFLCTFNSFSQKSGTSLNAKFKGADTVLLISHELPFRYLEKEKPNSYAKTKSKKNNSLDSLKLIINGKINYKIINESLVLRDKQIDSLIKIFYIPDKIVKITPTKCFEPHHAILIIKSGKTSYIELCFACRNFETSKDLENYILITDSIWPKLKTFFLRHGFRYEMGSH